MKVLLYSHVFPPSTGGVETVSLALAEGFAQRGVECKVLTRTPAEADTAYPFEVIRNADTARAKALVQWADVVLFNGASLALQPWVLLSGKPFLWVHVGYQASCIDGLGWVDGKPAPLTPWASVKFHAQREGWRRATTEGLKLMLRRFVARRLVTRNIAITQWMDSAQPLPRQVQIYNPFPIDRFHSPGRVREREFDFVYLGRLVSEKGVETLIRAFAKAVARSTTKRPRLLVIGDGERREELVQLAQSLSIESDVHFAGKQTGAALVDWVHKGRIGIVPSVWFEPMGGVAIELMAAGISLIVSQHGGLAECAGDAGLTFPNGDADALAECMLRLLSDPELERSLAQRAQDRAKSFMPDIFVDQYIELLRKVARSA
ncbi:glycosyltransferase family 4 protein [Variovorax sp. J22R133]|uniref:glycosyltransferase family 4 protein n=1 Tax=Variovorax brevis TaxID=3053503 RepID=UPI0025752AD1|nr:glycosyltransferase family 4 protein [Variovorax sp. J22R133]MDM0112976.1 glycosyltransferase family 4 protein [Variovorax sp. J22R133]